MKESIKNLALLTAITVSGCATDQQISPQPAPEPPKTALSSPTDEPATQTPTPPPPSRTQTPTPIVQKTRDITATFVPFFEVPDPK